MVAAFTGSISEYTGIILLNGHSVKLLLTFIIPSPHKLEQLSPQERSFFVQGMAVNIGGHI